LGELSAWVTPGLPIVLAGIYWMFGYTFIPVLIFNSLCVTLAYYLLFSLARLIFNTEVAFVVLALLWANIRVSYHIGNVLTEPLFFLLLSCMFFLSFKAIKDKRMATRWVIVLGLLSGYSFLVRPTVLPFVAGLCLLFLISGLSYRAVAMFLVISTLVVIPWLVRNYAVFGRFVISTNSVFAKIQGNHDGYNDVNILDTYKIVNVVPPYVTEIRMNAIRSGDRDTLFLETRMHELDDAFSRWKGEHFSLYVRLCVWRFKALLLPFTENMSTRNKTLSTIIWSFTFLPAFACVFLLRKRREYWTILGLALSFFLLPSLVVVDMYLRYQLPAQLLLTVLAGYFWFHVLSRMNLIWIRQRKST
jgi:4-amino-4-deoxy-L-arabinose transferase-like glycosyltransferase